MPLEDGGRGGRGLERRQPGGRDAPFDRVVEERPEGRHAAADALAGHEDLAQRGQRRPQLVRHGDAVEAAELRRNEPRGRLRELRQVADFGVAVRRQAGERNCAHLQAREVGHDELEHIGELEDGARPGADATPGEVKGEPVDQPRQLRVGDAALAVHHGDPACAGTERSNAAPSVTPAQ